MEIESLMKDLLTFRVLLPNELKTFQLIASWYFDEWKIPIEKTLLKLESISLDNSQFQVIAMQGDRPVATGGIYHHVGLLEKEPRFKKHKHWLGLVYTIPEFRHLGIGAELCKYIEGATRDRGIREVYLFSDTAVSLYNRLGWAEVETVVYGPRSVTVMKKEF
ncbi:GNAT family N-acetyltransferase [Leptospira sp. 85282-16]|uniref:GNAT family N-acetyltransferase n=1 Tax=Leptospira sp. 85282-16 TaxID=2971256 RepID=UPI0021BF3422|nr:GNAT family N-acetyltransferase [Leptospira sp. 85282-16]